MAARPSCLKFLAPVLLGFALFVGAIVARNFWLSLVLGLCGAALFAYVLSALLREQKLVADREKGAD